MVAHVAVIVGSLRKDSLNRNVAEALGRLAAGKLAFRFIEIGDLPLYNQDHENEPPASVTRFKRDIEAADAILFAMPEYNRSIPAALKNAIEWGSRPWGKNSWAGKPVAAMGVSPGAIGSAIAQQHLRSVTAVLDMAHMPQPELYLSYREGHVVDGEIADPGLRDLFTKWVNRFADWIERVGPVK
jgi:chromate reductase